MDWISGYELYWYNAGFSSNCDDNVIKQFDTFRSRNGYSEQGMHVLINACDADGGPALGTTDGGNPWQEDADAHTTTINGSYHPESEVNDSTIHEPMHAWSRQECPYCTEMMWYNRDGCGGSGCYEEHSLGTVFEDLYGNG